MKPQRRGVSAGPDRRRALLTSRLLRRVSGGLLAASMLSGAALGIAAAPAAAATATARSCDAVCAQSTLHRPTAATTLAVHWNRYPYAHQQDITAIDRWGNTERQCTGYVTWALNAMGIDFGMRDVQPNDRRVRFLAARSWARTARRGGWTVSHTPVVGAIAQWRAHESSHWQTSLGRASFTAAGDGHVGVVSHVFPDGTVLIRQYNVGSPDRSYSTMRARAPRYLYIGVT